jgi:hypothetical protein
MLNDDFKIYCGTNNETCTQTHRLIKTRHVISLLLRIKYGNQASESVHLPHLFVTTPLYKLHVASEINCIDTH